MHRPNALIASYAHAGLAIDGDLVLGDNESRVEKYLLVSGCTQSANTLVLTRIRFGIF